MEKLSNELFETLDDVQSGALVGGMEEQLEADSGGKTLKSTGTYSSAGGDISATVDFTF